LSGAEIVLIAPPLPAASRPSKQHDDLEPSSLDPFLESHQLHVELGELAQVEPDVQLLARIRAASDLRTLARAGRVALAADLVRVRSRATTAAAAATAALLKSTGSGGPGIRRRTGACRRCSCWPQ